MPALEFNHRSQNSPLKSISFYSFCENSLYTCFAGIAERFLFMIDVFETDQQAESGIA